MSLEDQVVDRWLFADMVQVQQDNVNSSVCKTGWSPIPNGFRSLRNTFRKGVLTTDCSSFDWTFPSWLVRILTLIILDQHREATDWWKRSVVRRIREVLGPDCTVVLPDGRKLRKKVWGIMPSGWLLTILLNSYGQLMLNGLAMLRAFGCYWPLWAMGDDVVLDFDATPEEAELLVEHLNRLGVIIKQWSKEREFAGFRFEGSKVDPCYLAKHCFLINNSDPKIWTELASSLALVYALASDESYARIAPFVERFSVITRPLARAWAYGMPVEIKLPRINASIL